MRRLALILAIPVAFALLAPSALAANPHFVGTPSLSVGATSVTASFKAAGLGNVTSATFT